jgi:S-formylglutathione hydrolase FrmB
MLRFIVVAVVALGLFAGSAGPARAQLFERVKPDHLNKKLAGRVVDHTANHGQDNRIDSPILGQKRDLYVYLPPGYDPAIAYPLVLFLHFADVDEHDFLDPRGLKLLDGMIQRGEFPPAVVACPDGTLEGKNRFSSKHSFYMNGRGGRFEDHVIQEVIPFLTRTYSIRPEREAHALLGSSAGGFGAMSLALKHREFFGAVATLGGPLNMLYDDQRGGYAANFDPSTYRERMIYDPDMIIARFYLGLWKNRAKKFLGPVYGEGPGVIDQIRQDNPADLLGSTGLGPGELAIYVNYPGKDNYNFDAQGQSFAWLARLRGVDVTLVEAPGERHTLRYFRSQERPAYLWLADHLLPPAPVPRG